MKKWCYKKHKNNKSPKKLIALQFKLIPVKLDGMPWSYSQLLNFFSFTLSSALFRLNAKAISTSCYSYVFSISFVKMTGVSIAERLIIGPKCKKLINHDFKVIPISLWATIISNIFRHDNKVIKRYKLGRYWGCFSDLDKPKNIVFFKAREQ